MSALLPPETGFRERLLTGLAEAIREHGSFHQATVADVVRRARTSRRTFYEHFEDREACFLALFDVVSETMMGLIAEAAAGPGGFEERVERALAAYLGSVAAEPVLARSCMQETPAIGPRGAARLQAMNERWAGEIVRLVDEARAGDPGLRPMSLEAATVITGGFRDLVVATLDRGRDPTELQAVGADMIRRLTTAG